MRKIISFNSDWLFSKDGKNWENVTLPHTWNNIDGQDGGNDYYRGKCVYKKTFPIIEGKVYIKFGAVNQAAEVFLNGKSLGVHKGGYSAFTFYLTEFMQPENEIVIYADNSVFDDVYPQTADFTFFGGIYRDVELICLGEKHFLPDTPVKVLPKNKNGNWTVELYAFEIPDDCKVKWRIFDENGTLSEAETGGFAEIGVNDPILWQGLENPHLYTVEAVLLCGGKECDRISEKIGFRTYSVDPEKGFYLNGKPYNLRGVSRHQDRKNKGYAISKTEHDEDIALIKEIGANSVRLAHYQHDKYFYDLCDKVGLVVWAEIPFITQELKNGEENAVNQMRELVEQCVNHPSVCFWALSNEITFGGVTENLINTHKRLIEEIKKLDDTRLTAIAHVYNLPVDDPFVKIADVCGYNLYFGWYVGSVEQFKPWMDECHRINPQLPLGLTEYGADALVKYQSGDSSVGDYTESYQALYHRRMLEQIDEMPYLWCTYVWNMFDFASDSRAEGGDEGINHKGLVTYDRKIKKDAFYVYKARWSKEPVLHIAGKRYVYRHEKITDVTVYSNLKEVELFVDGKSVGKKIGQYAFDFSFPIFGKHTVKAVSGGYSDEFVIEKTDKPFADYICGTSGNAANWFASDTHFSVKDKVKILAANKEARAVLEDVFGALRKARERSGAHTGNANPIETMGEFTLERVFNLVKAEGLLEQTEERLKKIVK